MAGDSINGPVIKIIFVLLVLGALWMTFRSGGPSGVPRLERRSLGPFDYAWSATTLDGETVDVADLRGRTIFLNVWAPWCPPCRAEMPSIQRLYEQVAEDGVAFLLVYRESPEDARRVVESMGLDLPVHHVREFPADWGVRAYPTTFVVAPDGTVVLRHTGAADWDAEPVAEFLRELAPADAPGQAAT